MKVNRIYNILSVLLGGMLVSMSCHREDVPGTDQPVDGGEPIEFSSVYASVDTKAEPDATSDLPANFKVWASRTVNSNTNYNVFGENGTTVTNTGSTDSPKWTYSPVRYWQSGEYNFIAVTPADFPTSGELTSNGLELSFGTSGWDLSANQTDLLLATSNVSNQMVSLSFSHLLTKISFSAKNSKTMTTEITSLKISGHHNIADAMLHADGNIEWQFNNATISQEIISSTAFYLSTTPIMITSDVLVFPENCALNLEVTIRHGQNANYYKKTAKIEATHWLPGKQYDYVIAVSPETINVTSTQVKDWVTDINGNNSNDDDIYHGFE